MCYNRCCIYFSFIFLFLQLLLLVFFGLILFYLFFGCVSFVLSMHSWRFYLNSQKCIMWVVGTHWVYDMIGNRFTSNNWKLATEQLKQYGKQTYNTHRNREKTAHSRVVAAYNSCYMWVWYTYGSKNLPGKKMHWMNERASEFHSAFGQVNGSWN